MTRHKKLKRRIRLKAAAAGMSYTAARHALSAGGPVEPRADDSHDRYKQSRYRFREESLQSWRGVVQSFGAARSWRDPVYIAEVLNSVATTALTNHVHFPDGGGLDLSGASSNTEPGCVRLAFQHGSSHVVCRPDVLRLETFHDDPLAEWSYFRLDLAELEPIGPERTFPDAKEHLTELGASRYGSSSDYFRDDDEDDEQLPSPSHLRRARRYLTGAFLLVPKASSYNAIPTMYDGRHSRADAVEFRHDIAQTVAALHAEDLYGVDPSTGARHWPRVDA